MVESSADEKRWLVAVDGSDASKEAFNVDTVSSFNI
mgnify:CR=1 FL=1